MLPIGNILQFHPQCHNGLWQSPASELCNMSSTFSRAQHVSFRIHAGQWTAAAVFVIGASACHKDPPPMQAPQVTVAPAVERVVADYDEFTAFRGRQFGRDRRASVDSCSASVSPKRSSIRATFCS